MSQVISIKRGGESINDSEIPNRGSRCFKLDNSWYFTTREGFSMGPYDSYELAEQGTRDYVAFVSKAEPHMLKLLTPTTQAIMA